MCGSLKPIEAFEKKDAQGRRRGACKVCRRPKRAALQRRYYAANPEVAKAKRDRDKSRQRLRRRHGMTTDERKALYDSQQGLCACCGLREATQVDHDHSCCPGAQSCGLCVRAMLCGVCNSTLGHAKDSASTLRACAAYIEAF